MNEPLDLPANENDPQGGPGTWLGFLIPNLFSIVLIAFSRFIIKAVDANDSDAIANIFIFSDFIVIPLLMGIISAYFWRNEGYRSWRYVGFSAINTVFAIFGSFFFLGEGYICLIIVSPLIFGFIVAGAFIGKAMFRRNNNTLNSSVLGFLVLVLIADVFSKHEFTNEVSDTITINAAPEKVWKYIVEYEPNKEPEDYWLFKVGMPSPVQSTVDGHFEGANRKCIFSNGYVFDEKMTTYKPNENLTFDITHQPRDPEIMGHIDITRGQFLLKANADGTTTLIGNSWYRLYVFPAWYFNSWASSITRNVHLRVMQYVKKLAEKDV
jgi:uncharacterized protein YndB with AHSA1/START domain